MTTYQEYKQARKPSKCLDGFHWPTAKQAMHKIRYDDEKVKLLTLWDHMDGWTSHSSFSGMNENAPPYENGSGYGPIRLSIIYDDFWNMDDLKGDCYNPDVNHDINPNVLKKQEKEFEDRVSSEGCTGLIAEYWDGTQWQEVYSCFGFVGDDWENSGYDDDAMQSAIDAHQAIDRVKYMYGLN